VVIGFIPHGNTSQADSMSGNIVEDLHCRSGFLGMPEKTSGKPDLQ